MKKQFDISKARIKNQLVEFTAEERLAFLIQYRNTTDPILNIPIPGGTDIDLISNFVSNLPVDDNLRGDSVYDRYGEIKN